MSYDFILTLTIFKRKMLKGGEKEQVRNCSGQEEEEEKAEEEGNEERR